MLVVDDDRACAGALAALLTIEGFEVTVANGGLEALERIKQRAPDVLITDIDMPDMDGVALLRAVRSRHEDTIALVVSGGNHAIPPILRSGALAYLNKPVEADGIIDLLHAALERRDEVRRLCLDGR